MSDRKTANRRSVAALVAIGLLLLLLATSAVLVWRHPKPAQAGSSPQLAGPAGKLSNWIEPPPSDRELQMKQLSRLMELKLMELKTYNERLLRNQLLSEAEEEQVRAKLFLPESQRRLQRVLDGDQN